MNEVLHAYATLSNHDDLYQMLIDLYENRSDSDCQKLNAKLILVLMNIIGDAAVIENAIKFVGDLTDKPTFAPDASYSRSLEDEAKVDSSPSGFALAGVHHVAYRCKNAKETVEFYESVLSMKYVSAFSENHVPSTGAYDPYMHVFLDCGNGNILAFFELPEQPEMDRDRNTPDWVQHIAFKVNSIEELLKGKAAAEAVGLDVIGPTYHGVFKSVYFFDPNGHRLELACDIGTAQQYEELKKVAPAMLDEWNKTKKAPRHAAWLHEPTEQM